MTTTGLFLLDGDNVRVLDLFCGAGGASMGYHRAGFEVIGVDINPQPHYPFAFFQADALTFSLDGFDLIHASPPCQAYSTMTRRNGTQGSHPRLVGAVRSKLTESGLPYIIENVPGAPLLKPITLCGTAFGLPLKRHRLFESNLVIVGKECNHKAFPKNIPILNHGKKLTQFVPVYGSPGGKAPHLWNAAMGISWMTKKEIVESIPPAYTEFLGNQIREILT